MNRRTFLKMASVLALSVFGATDANALAVTQKKIDEMNLRRLAIDIQKGIVDILNGFLYEVPSPETRKLISEKVQKYLTVLKNEGTIENFEVICDSSNNTDGSSEVKVDVYIKPKRISKVIEMDFSFG